jgi:hypothetical protein
LRLRIGATGDLTAPGSMIWSQSQKILRGLIPEPIGRDDPRSMLTLAALLLLGFAGCELALADEAAPPWPTKEWRSSTPEDQGMDSAALANLVDFGATDDLESLLVVRHGAIVAEAYYAPFRAGVKHRVNWVTKSVLGTLVAIGTQGRASGQCGSTRPGPLSEPNDRRSRRPQESDDDPERV